MAENTDEKSMPEEIDVEKVADNIDNAYLENEQRFNNNLKAIIEIFRRQLEKAESQDIAIHFVKEDKAVEKMICIKIEKIQGDFNVDGKIMDRFFHIESDREIKKVLERIKKFIVEFAPEHPEKWEGFVDFIKSLEDPDMKKSIRFEHKNIINEKNF